MKVKIGDILRIEVRTRDLAGIEMNIRRRQGTSFLDSE